MTGALSTFALQLETAQKVRLAQSSLNDTGETSKRLAKANHLVIELTDKAGHPNIAKSFLKAVEQEEEHLQTIKRLFNNELASHM